jgi:hypothetical protein
MLYLLQLVRFVCNGLILMGKRQFFFSRPAPG